MHPVLHSFHPLLADWFTARFGEPTEPQAQGWPEILKENDTLIAAPTGSGKTLTAFLACLDKLVWDGISGELKDETQVIYVSPLKALSNDIQKNLNEPLSELTLLASAQGTPLPEIRTAVRTGDTPPGERAAMLKKPPHILITTPESFYLLITSEKARRILKTARTVIIDEIHAVARDKRGSHLALSLERLDRLAGRHVPRIGLSATQRPIEEIARFLVGTRHVGANQRPQCSIVNAGHRRQLDIQIEVPKEELQAVASKELWDDVYDRVTDLIKEHRSTLVFVNTRRMVERATHALAQRLGDAAVAAHHGSLSKDIRLKAEEGLKMGRTRAVVATASLELGIDVGAVDLVCHLGTPRSLSVGLQRIGRAGHTPSKNVKEIVLPKGRIFPTTRDELIECAAFVYGVMQGHLEETRIPSAPLDILSQQIVAMIACEEMTEDELFTAVKGAWPYAALARKEFDDVVLMLSEGVSTSRGARGAWLHRDGISHILRPRRGARLAALTSGGAIPDNFNYSVVKEPEGTVVGTLEEDFAVESLSGDIFLLGNTSWRIKRVESGRVRVEDAHGQPPTIPFWLGEAPARSAELSRDVSDLRETIEPLLETPDRAMAFLEKECGLTVAGSSQATTYLAQAKTALGRLPTQKTLIAERFFDEGGGMQLILHAPFGGRLNRAFGLALRKKFCAGFNFELQAAATDDGILLSLGPQHSFPLDTVFDFVSSATVKDTLEQAVLDAPVFGVRWRWNATRALVLLRQMGGKRVPPVIQRMRSDDILSSVFPDQAACQENVTRPIKIPDHPLIVETMRNCLYEAMDLEGLKGLLVKIENREVTLIAKETPTPSPLTHEILNSNPYTYLDDAPLEERRARAVSTRRVLSEEDLRAFGALDENAIRNIAEEIKPDIRNRDELADVLRERFLYPLSLFPQEWMGWMETLITEGRAKRTATHFISVEKETIALLALERDDEAVSAALRAWMMGDAPAAPAAWALRTGLNQESVERALLKLEAAGNILRGRFTAEATQDPSLIEWADREILARIHRRSLSRLRQELAPVTTAEFMRYLLRWQHVAPQTQLVGIQGVTEVIAQLEGLEIPAAAWEEEILPARIADYQPHLLDQLCLNGTVVWGKLLGKSDEEEAYRRSTPNRNTTLSLMLREDLPSLLKLTSPKNVETSGLGESARALVDLFRQRGAMFFNELQAMTGRLRTELDVALWELVSAGLITCDGFSGVRNLIDPSRRREKARLLAKYSGSRRPIVMGSGGRWSLLRMGEIQDEPGPLGEPLQMEAYARLLLHRWGVVFRDITLRESFSPPWRVLLNIYRRLEARGEIRGGRFVSAFAGEQYALPEAVEALRAAKRTEATDADAQVTLSAADPLNLTGILTPPPRIPATLSHWIQFDKGVPGPAAKHPRLTHLIS